MTSQSKIDLVEKALRRLTTTASSEPALSTQIAQASTPSGTALRPLSRMDENIPEKFKASLSIAPASTSDQGDVSHISKDEYVKAMNSASLLDQNVIFQTLNPYHLLTAKPLYSLFYRLDLTELEQAISDAKLRLNKGLFQFALTLALLHRTDVRASIPSHITYSPYLYFDLGELEAFDKSKTEDGTEDRKPLNAPWDKSHADGFQFERLDYGIDKLGDMVWAFPDRSINLSFYGNLHNDGHMVIGYSHDAKGLYYKQSEGSAMTLLETAARDPVFYRWHSFIDDIFERYKSTLPEYKISELEFEGIRVDHFETRIPGKNVLNELRTKWMKDRVDITDGIPEERKKYLTVKKIYYDFVHLAHEDFEYRLTVFNERAMMVKGVFRIFIAPIYTDQEYVETLYRAGKQAEEEARKRNKYLEPSFNKLRRKFIELDKFVETLKPGQNSITRKSTDSTVTVPIKQLFQTVDDAIEVFKCQQKKVAGGQSKDTSAWCGCGWPDYMLIGRGTTEGLPCHLFVMITDYEKDKIDDETMKGDADKCCKASLSYCGLRDKLYPDKKPMGFPFDRKMKSDELLLKDFVTKTRDTHEIHPVNIPNMKVTDMVVKHFSGQPGNGPTII